MDADAGKPCCAVPDSPNESSSQLNLHIMSWNVAGWRTTIENIRRFKGGLPTFLQKHHVDILCLQEVKLPSKAIASEAIPLCAEIPGFDTFWACNEGSGSQRQGLNGIATFVRQGLALRADSAPLGVPELDGEGRCLLTDHGNFVIFNVYVPNSSGGPRLPFKLRWLRALQQAMKKARVAGKAVMLAGDLNMKHRAQDSHWTFRPFEVSRLPELLHTDKLCNESDALADVAAACTVWPLVRASLQEKEHQQIETRNSRNGQTFQRWAVFAKSKQGDRIRLGPPMESEGHARGSFLVDGMGVEADGTMVLGHGSECATHILQRPDEMSAAGFAECVKKIAGIDVNLRAQKVIADSLGRVSAAPSVHQWLSDVLTQDDMVDSFAEFYPNAEERFTCWDQYRNKRHENVGSRIDYILGDRGFFNQHAVMGVGLDVRGKWASESAAAALSAATLGGLSQPSSFAGGGMPTLEGDEFNAQFRDQPSTGIIYTPPQLSDHVAVSVLLHNCARPLVASSLKDSSTLRCQPHRTAKRITDFFSRKGSKESVDCQLPPAKRIFLSA